MRPCSFVATTGADLVKLNQISERIFDEYLVRILTYQSLNLPEPDSLSLQLLLRLLNVLNGQRYVRKRGILLCAARKRRHSFGAHQVNRRGMFEVPYKHPVPGNAWKIRPFRIAFKTEHVRVEAADAFHLLRSGPNSNAVVVQFKYFDRHSRRRLESIQPDIMTGY